MVCVDAIRAFFLGEYIMLELDLDLLEQIESLEEKLDSAHTVEDLQDMHPSDFYRFLCDVVGVTYHTPKEKVLELIKEKL